MIVTIDGPAGTGKTTIARRLAEKLGYDYFDTGAMYRAATYQILRQKIDIKKPEELSCFLDHFRFEIRSAQEGKRYFIGEEDVTEEIRSAAVTGHVSEVSANAAIREALVRVQREFGASKKAVFEGRDMGTVVFPKADVKIFLTARPSVRAERRYLELKEKNALTSEREVMRELLERDHLDSTREASPLVKAEDAHLVDTSDLTLDQVIDRVMALIPS
ncbi:MAG: (d)CMP kinase [Chlamydiales bacterium]|nr:(d)CMP kinase [Chlamydiales bacterium]